MGLTVIQAQELTRADKADIFFDHKKDVYDAFVPFKNEVTDFRLNLTGLKGVLHKKNVVTTGITTDKNTLKHDVAEMAALICRKTRAFALKMKDDQLAAQTNYFEDRIFRMRDTELLPWVTSLVNIITPLLPNAEFTPYGVTAGALSNLAAKAKEFDGLIGKAPEMESHATEGDNEINEWIKKLRANYEQFDLLIDEFAEKDPEFVQGYHINSSVDKIGVRHTGIQGIVKAKDGEGIGGAVIKLRGSHYETKSDLFGNYRLEKVRAGDYIIDVTADSYEPATLIHHISKGKIDDHDFVLTPIA